MVNLTHTRMTSVSRVASGRWRISHCYKFQGSKYTNQRSNVQELRRENKARNAKREGSMIVISCVYEYEALHCDYPHDGL